MAIQWQLPTNSLINGYAITASNSLINGYAMLLPTNSLINGYAMTMTMQWQWLYNDNFQQTA
jgi:hypothetical protein